MDHGDSCEDASIFRADSGPVTVEPPQPDPLVISGSRQYGKVLRTSSLDPDPTEIDPLVANIRSREQVNPDSTEIDPLVANIRSREQVNPNPSRSTHSFMAPPSDAPSSAPMETSAPPSRSFDQMAQELAVVFSVAPAFPVVPKSQRP
ncbi:hypothetical protein Cni_G08815 [Canna indica]|uniref:Uncharacterized protein n=1 Tax=Canna indica TaxID=4628 RepID=A0AAQ3K1L0_9LILI|nr:hypothetical protein Cni_G08815 [Canna indica]